MALAPISSRMSWLPRRSPRRTPGICNMVNVHNSPVCAALCEYGTREQKERYLRPLARGEIFGAFLLTEPEAGSDAGALQARAVRVGDEYIIKGTKQFITSGRTADIAMILAVTEPEAGRKGISCFITPTKNPGYVVVREEDKLGHRNCDTCQIAFEDMKVPASDMLGEPGAGYRIALANLNSGRIGVAAQAVGVARAALDSAIRYSRERHTFGKPIIDHQAIGFKLAEMATQVEAAHQLTLHAAQMKDAGLPCLKEASMAKLNASEVAGTRLLRGNSGARRLRFSSTIFRSRNFIAMRGYFGSTRARARCRNW